MEADWSVEIGPGLPWIDAAWPGFVDLRAAPHAIDTLPEPARHAALRSALLGLNAPASPFFTSKCDAWPLSGDEIDPYEFNAAPQTALAGFTSYIDILNCDPVRFQSFALTEQHARNLTAHLRQLDMPYTRIDIVLRRAAATTSDSAATDGYGISLYAAACGASHATAYMAWQTALAAAVAATITVAAQHTGE